jgi:hypothetical protein
MVGRTTLVMLLAARNGMNFMIGDDECKYTRRLQQNWFELLGCCITMGLRCQRSVGFWIGFSVHGLLTVISVVFSLPVQVPLQSLSLIAVLVGAIPIEPNIL